MSPQFARETRQSESCSRINPNISSGNRESSVGVYQRNTRRQGSNEAPCVFCSSLQHGISVLNHLSLGKLHLGVALPLASSGVDVQDTGEEHITVRCRCLTAAIICRRHDL